MGPKGPTRVTEVFLEVDLATELQQPRVDDRVRVAPARAVGARDGPNVTGVHQVVGVEVQLEPEPTSGEDLAGTDIESADPTTVEHIIPYHRHDDSAAATGQRSPAVHEPESAGGEVPVRSVVGPGQVLIGEAHQEFGRQRDRSEQFELCLRAERLGGPAVQQLLWRVNHETLVLDSLSSVKAATERDAVLQPSINSDVEEVVAVDGLSEE